MKHKPNLIVHWMLDISNQKKKLQKLPVELLLGDNPYRCLISRKKNQVRHTGQLSYAYLLTLDKMQLC